MKIPIKNILNLTAIFFLSNCAVIKTEKKTNQYGKNIGHSFISEVFGNKIPLNYLMFFPETFVENKKYPLIVFLHGMGARGDEIEGLEKHWLPALLEQKKEFPFVVLSPRCPAGKWWEGELLDAVFQLTTNIIVNNNIDTNRIYLTGLSMGGYGTWNLIKKYPDIFAAFAPLCAGGKTNGLEKAVEIPAWAFHGDKDMVVKKEKGASMVQAFKAAGGEIKFTILPDVGHDVWTPVYGHPTLFRWFLETTKSGTAKIEKETADYFNEWEEIEKYRDCIMDPLIKLQAGRIEFLLSFTNKSNITIEQNLKLIYPEGCKWILTFSQTKFILKPGENKSIRVVAEIPEDKRNLFPLPVVNYDLLTNKKIKRTGEIKFNFDDREYFANSAKKIDVLCRKNNIIIDGVINDYEWKGQSLINRFDDTFMKNKFDKNAFVSLCYDKNYLYLCGTIFEKNTKLLKSKYTERDSSVYRDDNVSFCIDSDIIDKEYFHFIINNAGTVMDGKIHNREWNANIDAKTSVNSNSWSFEARIPLKDLDLKNYSGNSFGFNILWDSKQDAETKGIWNPTFGWIHIPSRFGTVTFK